MASPLRPRALVLVAAFLIALPAPVARAAPTLDISVTPIFSPNGDGRSDEAVVTIATDAATTVSIDIVDAGGSELRALASDAPVDGAREFRWDGLTDGGVAAIDGRYRVRVTADGEPGAETAGAPVALDTVAPTFAWRSIAPEPIRTTDPVRFSFALGDRFSERIRLSMTVSDAEGRAVERGSDHVREVGVRSVSWDARGGGGPVSPGLYGVRFTLVDEVGNARTTRVRPFRNHRLVTSTVIHRVEHAGARVALTFDDCIYGHAWSQIISALEGADSTATFFCNGTNLAANASQARRTVRADMAIGSHTWSHPDLLDRSPSSVTDEVAKDQAAWWRIARTTPAPLFRPPFGSYDRGTLDAAGEAGSRWTVLWDVDPQDWSSVSSEEIRRRVVSGSRPGSIVVLHVQPRTADALPGILAGLRRRGLRSVSVPELLRAGGLTS